LPLSGYSLAELFSLIVRGLHAFHFGTIIAGDCHVEVLPLTIPPLQDMFRCMLSWRGAARTRMDLGQKTFEYEGVQGIDNPQISVWVFEMFGGVHVSVDGMGGVQRLILGATVGPLQVEQRAAQLAQWHRGWGTTV